MIGCANVLPREPPHETGSGRVGRNLGSQAALKGLDTLNGEGRMVVNEATDFVTLHSAGLTVLGNAENENFISLHFDN